MSKASEWKSSYADILARRPESYTAPPSDDDKRRVHARVTDAGDCSISIHGATLAPDIAVALARWIINTFGETPTPPGEER